MHKFKYFAFAILLFTAGNICAEMSTRRGGRKMPEPGMVTTEAAYISSASCVSNVTPGQEVVISSKSAIFFGVSVTSGGIGSPLLQFFDSSVTTAGVRLITTPIDARTAKDWPFETNASSGITVSNSGTTPACFTAFYLEFQR